MMDTDRLILGEGSLNHYWTLCFADEALRQRLGLRYISQMHDTHPYWYLWFADWPGVFKLSMVECRNTSEWDWQALFQIKYYPQPQEKVFAGLSVLEQVCRMSEVFQTVPAAWNEGETGCACHGESHHHGVRFEDLQGSTGAPNIEWSAEIPADFFLAGQMTVSHRDGQHCEVSWESQDWWRVQMTENYYIPNQEGNTLKVLRRGDIDREFPGWMLTDFVARRFADGWQELHGFARVDESTGERDGLEFTSDGRTLNAVVSSTTRHLSVCRRMQS